MRRVAIIMAGGAGERFWPLSKPDFPKQLLQLSGSGKTMLEEAVDRVEPLVGIDNVYISTVPRLVEPISKMSAGVSADRILAEPAKRNTAGALCWSIAAISAKLNEPFSAAIVTADHRIEPPSAFQATVRSALTVAEERQGLVTIGIRPTRAETGYGYIELGETVASPEVPVRRVKRFREKPAPEVAEEYFESGHFLWNSGMFFWTTETFLEELDHASSEHASFIHRAIPLLAQGKVAEASALFEDLPNISIDYALMERASRVFVAEAAFDWDDLGSWDSLERVRPLDSNANVIEGSAGLVDSSGCIVVNKGDVGVFALGIHDLVVVVTELGVMICPKDRAQEVRKLSALAE